MHFGVQTEEAHKERCSRTGMTEDEKFLAWEELLDFRHFLWRDGRDWIAFFLFRVAFEDNAGDGFKARKHSDFPVLIIL
jgi:hypothetical protein